MRLLYFAWVRERVGKAEEQIDPPAGVATVSSHREAAFAAAAFLMDYLKTRAPFWKQVEKATGSAWVSAQATDDAAAERWSVPPPRRHEAAK